MSRTTILALGLAAAGCGQITEAQPGPRDAFYRPTGIAALGGTLLVASSNADLRYDDATGGSLISVSVPAAPGPAALDGAINLSSFSGELALASPADPGNPCAVAGAGAVAVLPVRGADLVYLPRVAADGAVTCDGCGLPIGSADRGDPFAAGLACGDGMARAYVGYLRTSFGATWLTQIDLTRADLSAPGAVQHRAFGDFGYVRGFAYDASRKRLYFTRTVTGAQTSLRWVDLAGGCSLDGSTGPTCRSDTTRFGVVPEGLELRGIALSSTAVAGRPRRAYVTARIYDPVAAGSAGIRIGDYDGLLLVVDLAEDAFGRLEFRIVDQLAIGYGASDVRVLPPRAGKRDVVAALAVDDGVLWIYDDETGARVAIGRDPATGVPLAGRVPFGVAVDPVTLPGDVARVYVGSFREDFVTPIDVPLADPEAAAVVLSADGPWRIGPGVAP